jgi:hypothetical protein
VLEEAFAFIGVGCEGIIITFLVFGVTLVCIETGYLLLLGLSDKVEVRG